MLSPQAYVYIQEVVIFSIQRRLVETRARKKMGWCVCMGARERERNRDEVIINLPMINCKIDNDK